MKKIFFLLFVIASATLNAQETGHEIKVVFKPFKNEFIYLGHYQGKQLPIIDSVFLNEKSEAVFKGPNKLSEGIYLIGYPNKNGFFEFLIGKQQHFSIAADTANQLSNIKFVNSLDNVLFNDYQKFMMAKGNETEEASRSLSASTTKADSAKWNEKIKEINTSVQQYRSNVLKNNPDAMISFLLKAMKEPEIPENEKQASSDSLFAYRYYKTHFWDGVNFFDDRLLRTPFFESRVDKYFEQLVYPQADSVIKEIDWMMSYASINPDMQKFLLLKFVNRYLNQKYMWEDAIFVHLYEKYFSNKNYSWLTEAGKKTITDRAYSLMANIFGSPAADIDLPDLLNKKTSLYSVKADFVLVALWDPTCGHCKEVLPKLDSMYREKWKNYNLKIYAMAKETDGKKEDWFSFIDKHKLQDWVNVYYSKEADNSRINSGIPGYSQLYDVKSFPTLYLLDKDKRIIAKKLSFEQIDEVLSHKLNLNN
jgi:thiol-disulfide isomerase/thioredoxin